MRRRNQTNAHGACAVGVRRNVTDGEGIFAPLDSPVVIDGDTAVALEWNAAGLEVFGSRRHANTQDHQVGS